jgi:hypothetical protein
VTREDLVALLRDELAPIQRQLDDLITDARTAATAAQGSEGAAREAAALVAQLVETVAALAERLGSLELAHKERTNGDGNRCRLPPIPENPTQ